MFIFGRHQAGNPPKGSSQGSDSTGYLVAALGSELWLLIWPVPREGLFHPDSTVLLLRLGRQATFADFCPVACFTVSVQLSRVSSMSGSISKFLDCEHLGAFLIARSQKYPGKKGKPRND
jgi:hypothetical protein